MGAHLRIDDWNDAYANRAHIPNAQEYIDKWELLAPDFRQQCRQRTGSTKIDLSYGDGPRERFDLFYPGDDAVEPRGLFVFVHGGYWMAFDKSDWSHLARWALDQGWAVAIPSYTLCPQVKISDITVQIGRAIEQAAQLVAGPIILAGHSAGGHLVSRMGCTDNKLSEETRARIRRIISISGVHDLRPLMRLELNQTLQISEAEALAESPALRMPIEGIEIDCVVGGNERPEFIRQNALLANIWLGLGAHTREIVVNGKHHFDIIDELYDGSQGWLDLT